MLDPFTTEALRRLDGRLLDVCDLEERRAELLVGDGVAGWDGVRNMVRPTVADLGSVDSRRASLLPGDDGVLRRIGKALDLEELELELLVVLLAPHVEPRYAAIYGVLQDDPAQAHPTERLIRAVLAPVPGQSARLATLLGATGRLVRGGFVTRVPGGFAPLARPFALAEDIVATLLGDTRPPIPDAQWQNWARADGEDARAVPLLVVHGHGDRAAMARAHAGADEIVEVGLPTRPDAVAVARAAWRVGVCTGALPLVDGAELNDDDARAVGHELQTLVRDLGGRAWLLTRNPVSLSVPHVEAVAPAWVERRDAWLAEADSRGLSLDPLDAERMASRHRINRAQIGQVLDAATVSDFETLDAMAASMMIRNVAHSVRVVPDRTFDDLVLRDTTRDGLDRLLHFMRMRERLGDELGLERRYRLERGPITLFSGRSGTGKSLAAEAVAATLGRPLHSVDLANLMSKYIGDSEKHVDEVLTDAERASAVLFFDEADSLFSNRLEKASSGSEHFTNMLVGYLLQRIELHHGLVILATNLRHSIDEAFVRRFQFRIEFPHPDADERRRIWELMLPVTVARDPDVDLAALAQKHRLPGGDIRNAALKAIFLAEQRGRPLSQVDLERAVALELLEMGRLSRRAGPVSAAEDGGRGDADRGELLRACLDDLHDQLDDYLRERFLKEIHLVHGSPTEDRLAGKRPAVSIALFRVAARRGDDGLRVGLIISAWASVAEEESELLGVLHQALSSMTLHAVHGHPAKLRVQESNDFDLLYRFWSSHDHPVRASIVVDAEIE